MAPAPKKPSKPIFKTSSTFTATKWPSISHDVQETVTELLCNVIMPLGEHRKAHSQPSGGKKRKREAKSDYHDTPPSIPAVGSHILIGINSVTKHLEALAASTAPPILQGKKSDVQVEDDPILHSTTVSKPEVSLQLLSMVIISHPQPSLSPSYAHIPTLLHLASRSISKLTSKEPTRLVTLPTSYDARLASALHIPRAGAIGIYEDAPGAKALEEYVRKHVGLTECLWVDEALNPEWRGLNVVQA